MPNAYIFYGPPACGKSTKAMELIQKLKTDKIMHIERDYIRFNMLKLGDWTTYSPDPKIEYVVDSIWKHNVFRAIENNAEIVISDTLLKDRDRKNIIYLLETYGYNVVVERMDLPLEECLRRNALRGNFKVNEDVLTKMWEKHNGNNQVRVYSSI